ncbi:glycosyltransferase family 2 protein [Bordetella sp. N]|uniref:glycosyltransferase n=1 Tax=Bordetella sp. N TaxID=1746199 RepID=UPI0007111E72|nr:glycosyltransferase family 2 protein [Bordetella sp. N]ALM86111.1 glycosyl transferase [Bordetella sp. N]
MPTEQIAARTALVLETNNLRGGADLHKVAESLTRLMAALRGQTLPLTSLAQVVITHDGLPATVCSEIESLAGRTIDFVRIDPATGYYEAKNLGFDRTDPARCDYVAFGDADCKPSADWLAQLLAPFAADAPPRVVAGRTSYAETVAGTALTTIDFMYFPSRLGTAATANFYANNVAFEHAVFEQYRYQPLDGVYRAHCQVLGLRLVTAGIPLHYAPRAHTEHRLPDSRLEALQLRWMRGQDSVGLTPFLVRTYAPARMQWLGRSGPIGPLCVLAIRLRHSLRALNRQDLQPVRGLRRLAAVTMILGFSAVDALGALARGLGLDTTRRGADAQALSYHRH